jgi:hypothetical protein
VSKWAAYERHGSFLVGHAKRAIFPLLCPKAEEAWIPGWQCEVLHSRSGRNEPGAVFRTVGAFGGEVIWYTREYDQARGVVEFVREDFPGRLRELATLMEAYLSGPGEPSGVRECLRQ